MLEAFSFFATIAELSRIFREILRGIPENGYLDDMCYIKFLQNLNFPFIIGELSRTNKYPCHVRFYINPLQQPLDRCSIYMYTYICDSIQGHV